MHPHLRVARATDHFAEVLRFYRDGLGFAVLGEFHDHEGFDGVMLGLAGAGYARRTCSSSTCPRKGSTRPRSGGCGRPGTRP
jgi:hypothetical protein